MSPITSLHNPRVKQAARLRTRRGRQQQHRIIIDGAREIGRALDAGLRLVDAFVHLPEGEPLRGTESGAPSAEESLRRRLHQAGVPCWDVSAAVFEKIGYGERGGGVVAVAETPPSDLSGWNCEHPTLVAVLESLEKPGNVGAILRSADAAGVDGVILADPVSDLYNPNTIRSSLGTVFSLAVHTADSPTARDWLRQRGLRILVARVDGSVPLHQTGLREPAAVVVGSEASGVSAHWRAADMQAVRLPMRGTGDSLNVSATAAVIFYEALRQREAPRAGDREAGRTE